MFYLFFYIHRLTYNVAISNLFFLSLIFSLVGTQPTLRKRKEKKTNLIWGLFLRTNRYSYKDFIALIMLSELCTCDIYKQMVCVNLEAVLHRNQSGLYIEEPSDG